MAMQVKVKRTPDVLLAKRFGASPPGTFISYDVVENECGFPYPHPKFWACMRKFRNKLLRGYNRATVVVPREGINIVPAEQHMDVAASHTKRAWRSARRGLAVLKHTRMKELTADQRTSHVEATARVAAIVGVAKLERDKLARLIVGATPQLPSAADVVAKL